MDNSKIPEIVFDFQYRSKRKESVTKSLYPANRVLKLHPELANETYLGMWKGSYWKIS